jgi:peptidoglycan hydrolase CwlO-like protein
VNPLGLMHFLSSVDTGSLSIWIPICLGIITAAVTVSAFRLSTGANKTQAKAATAAVDAEAYDRAQKIYEGAIDTLKGQVSDLTLQVDRWRESNQSLEREMIRLRNSNNELSRQLANFGHVPDGLGLPPESSTPQ